MNKNKVLDFELIKYEKNLKDIVNVVGINKFNNTEFELLLTSKEKELLVKCAKTTMDLIEGLLKENEHFVETFSNQVYLLEKLDESIHCNTNLCLTPSQHEWPLISLEIGGKIDQDSKLAKNKVDMFWSDKDYIILVNLFEKFLDKYKIIVKIISPNDIPEYLRE